MANSFKTCACCGNGWATLVDLIRDEQVQLIGYQPAFSDSYEGLFFFAHSAEECGTTIAVPVSSFANLYDGPLPDAQSAGTEQFDLRWVRDIITILESRGPEEVLARFDQVELQKRCA